MRHSSVPLPLMLPVVYLSSKQDVSEYSLPARMDSYRAARWRRLKPSALKQRHLKARCNIDARNNVAECWLWIFYGAVHSAWHTCSHHVHCTWLRVQHNRSDGVEIWETKVVPRNFIKKEHESYLVQSPPQLWRDNGSVFSGGVGAKSETCWLLFWMASTVSWRAYKLQQY